jgi:hypothetical protein
MADGPYITEARGASFGVCDNRSSQEQFPSPSKKLISL